MMDRCAISNIAWPADRDGEALDLAAELGFAGVELAPGKVFGPLDSVEASAVRDYRRQLSERELAVPALQAILFGVEDAHLFASPEKRARLASRLDQVATLAELVGAGACVFGSPTLRDPGETEPGEAWRIAVDFFGAAAESFIRRGTTLCFEANPPVYRCRFVTRTEDAIALVREVGRDGFGLQLDMGTVFINGEASATVEEAARLAGHCHISEPDLVPVGSSEVDHARTGAALSRSRYAGWRSVEMRSTEDWQVSMRGAAAVVRKHYATKGARR